MGIKDAAVGGLMHGFRAVASRFRDVPPKPRTHRCFAVTVSEVADVAAHLRRITVQAPELRDYRPTGPDEYFGLVIPPAGKDLVLPEPKGLNIRAELGAIPEESRPDLRWYPVRSHDPAAGRLLIDVVTHGDNGPGSAWALRTGPGDAVGLRTLTSAWRRTEAPQLLVADPSSAPALRAIVEACSPVFRRRMHVRVVGPGPEYFEPGLTSLEPGLASMDVLYAPVEESAAAVVENLRDAGPLDVGYAWLCGEAGLAKAARRLVVREGGVARTEVLFSGYWRRATAAHEGK